MTQPNYDEAIRKADVLLEALNWIRRFRGRHVVIKLGGSTMEETAAVKHLLTDVIFLESVGMRPILVHGGGKAINKAMDAEAGRAFLAKAGLLPDDLIVFAEGELTPSVRAVQAVLARVDRGQRLRLTVSRGQDLIEVTLEPPAPQDL